VSESAHPIVGVWIVHAAGAPFEHHVMLFHADGTMVQSNPDAGNPATSDSSGLGVWQPEGLVVRGRFVEITADRVTHAARCRGEISFVIRVRGDELDGTCETRFVDLATEAPGPSSRGTLTGTRLRPFSE